MKALVMVILLAALGCYAQGPGAVPTPSPTETQTENKGIPEKPIVTVPPGTEVLLSLVRPVSTRTTKAGDKVYLQTTAPVLVGGKLAIPAGTFLEGTLDKAVHASWASRRGEIHLRLASLVFGNGYTVSVAGKLDLTTNLEESTSTYGDAGNAAPIALASGSLGGAGIGALANGAKGAAVGGIAGGVAGAVISLALALHHGGVFMDIGTPVDLILNNPLDVEQGRALNAARQYTPAPISPPRPVQRVCYDPGSPGTPDTVIPGTPGTPGTPPTVIPGPPGSPPTVIPGTPGTPGTPDTVIPGTPPTPGRSYPCPPNWP